NNIERLGAFSFCKQLFDLDRGHRQFPSHESCFSEIAAILDGKRMRCFKFFPPLQRCTSLSHTREQSSDGAPCFQLSGAQQVRVARLGICLAPSFLVDQSKCLMSESARLPAFDCPADRWRSEIEANAEHHDNDQGQ